MVKTAEKSAFSKFEFLEIFLIFNGEFSKSA